MNYAAPLDGVHPSAGSRWRFAQPPNQRIEGGRPVMRRLLPSWQQHRILRFAMGPRGVRVVALDGEILHSLSATLEAMSSSAAAACVNHRTHFKRNLLREVVVIMIDATLAFCLF
jgi:hypothetical protein